MHFFGVCLSYKCSPFLKETQLVVPASSATVLVFAALGRPLRMYQLAHERVLFMHPSTAPGTASQIISAAENYGLLQRADLVHRISTVDTGHHQTTAAFLDPLQNEALSH